MNEILYFNLAAPAPPRVARALSAPSIAHDGRLVACSGKDLLGFEPNGSFAWIVPLGHTCNDSIGPVFQGEQVGNPSQPLHDLCIYEMQSLVWLSSPSLYLMVSRVRWQFKVTM